ncbi:MAG: thioredoxin family protein [Brevinematales bacterium]|nr:thioredoxin family protein [Brevinematales bacterium]
MKIQILGGGCANCKRLEENAKEAIKALGINAEIEKITDFNQIMNYGVMMTPALAVDGIVKSTGKVLTKEQIINLLK